MHFPAGVTAAQWGAGLEPRALAKSHVGFGAWPQHQEQVTASSQYVSTKFRSSQHVCLFQIGLSRENLKGLQVTEWPVLELCSMQRDCAALAPVTLPPCVPDNLPF